MLTWCTGWEMLLRSRQPLCEHQGDKGWACWTRVSGAASDLLGDLSALSSYEDALAEAMYEELDHLVTQKEGLLGSPGGCLCLPSWDLWLSHPLGVHIFSASADPTRSPGSQRRLLQRGRMASQSPVTSQPLSTLQKPGLSLLSLNSGPVGVGRKNSVCSVMFVST